ncbi:MAG: uroporphyrinogen-III synthase [Gammaproteobacteria bacterium]|nr:uroporphyrinogen-III synthase [Gammaproteobacteria bacterium]
MQTVALEGIRVLVTRPVHQAQTLCDMVTERGGQATRFPVIEIEPLNPSARAANLINNPGMIDFAVFISPNAVEYGLRQLLAQGEIPDKLKLVTIGGASALKLRQLIGRTADICPLEHYNSEALLALESLQYDAVNKKRVIIFRGLGGRELLATTLRQRGAKVDYAEVYQRRRPEVDNNLLDAVWGRDTPDIVTVTSSEGLTNLVAMVGKKYQARLLQTPLVVVTEKMRLYARTLGFNADILVAAKASNEALLESVQELFSVRE